jgi:carboxypeptidase PM20D1
MKECTRAQAERLGEAIRFRTVTLISTNPSAEPGYAAFARLMAFLRSSFPRASQALRWEQIGELALLLTWAPDDVKPPAASPVQKALLFYAHFDVVPPGDESAWTHGAFSGEVADGFIWGRGALDDKNCLMGILEAVEELLAEGARPRTTIYIAFGGDEETTGVLGAQRIADSLAGRGVRLSCVLDEGSAISDGIVTFVKRPIAMIGIAEKGFANAELIVRGNAGHSSMPGRGTAAGALAAILAGVERRRFPIRLTPTAAGFFRAVAPWVPGLLGCALRLIRPLWPFLGAALAANPSLDAMVRTTQAVTILRAGEKENVLPAEARAVVNLRLLPGDTAAGVLRRIDPIARGFLPDRFSLEVRLLPGTIASNPVPETRPDRELWTLICDAVRAVEPRAIIAPFLVVVYTDSRKFASLADCIVRLHPVVLTADEIGRIHSRDERISLENYGRMIAFYAHLMRGGPAAVAPSAAGRTADA